MNKSLKQNLNISNRIELRNNNGILIIKIKTMQDPPPNNIIPKPTRLKYYKL